MNVGLQVHRKIKLLLKLNNLLEDLIVEYRDAFCSPPASSGALWTGTPPAAGALAALPRFRASFVHDHRKCHFLQHLAMEAHFISENTRTFGNYS